MANDALAFPCNAHLTPYVGLGTALTGDRLYFRMLRTRNIRGSTTRLSLCLDQTTSPRRGTLGCVPRGMRSAGTPPPTAAAGAPPAGPWQELVWQFVLQRLV
jgi:hypothetical protein